MPDPINNNANQRKKLAVLLSLLTIVGIFGGYYFWTRGQVKTDDAYVDGRIFAVTPRISGYIMEILVADNQKVAAGELLLQLDPTEFEVALAKARAELAQAEATLTALELGVPLEENQTVYRVRGAQADINSLKKTLEKVRKDEEAGLQEIEQAQALYDQSLLDLKRTQKLMEGGASAQSALDAAETQTRTLLARLQAARARHESAVKYRASLQSDMNRLNANIALAGTGKDAAIIKSRQVEAQQAEVALQKTAVRQAELNLSYTQLVAPADGHVTRKQVEAGIMVSRGQALMAIVPLKPEDLWITANFKETQLTRIRPGQPVVIRVDSFPGVKITGRVESIMAGTGAVFSLFPPENASGNFVKIVQRIPVKILIDPAAFRDLPGLRVGMSVVPTIYTEN